MRSPIGWWFRYDYSPNWVGPFDTRDKTLSHAKENASRSTELHLLEVRPWSRETVAIDPDDVESLHS